jgi:hypothetical protein
MVKSCLETMNLLKAFGNLMKILKSAKSNTSKKTAHGVNAKLAHMATTKKPAASATVAG